MKKLLLLLLVFSGCGVYEETILLEDEGCMSKEEREVLCEKEPENVACSFDEDRFVLCEAVIPETIKEQKE